MLLPLQDGELALLPWGWGREKVVEKGRMGADGGEEKGALWHPKPAWHMYD